MSKNVIYVKIFISDFASKEVFIHSIPMQSPNVEQYLVLDTWTQIPFHLCFAMTINKPHGQTLNYIIICLKKPLSSHVQIYVALSRMKHSFNCETTYKPMYFDHPHIDHTKIIVYKKVIEPSQIIIPNPMQILFTSILFIVVNLFDSTCYFSYWNSFNFNIYVCVCVRVCVRALNTRHHTYTNIFNAGLF